MPLNILLPMVIIGIGGVAVLLHMLGLSQRATFNTKATAHAAWLREFPDDAPDRVTVSQNRQAALIEGGWGRGIVWTMGADTTARHLAGARVVPTEKGVCIMLPDYTAPQVDLALDQSEAPIWASLLEDHPA